MKRRSKPVNGSVPVFSASLVAVGVVALFVGSLVLVAGVDDVFSGEVPVVGVVAGVVVGVVVGVVAGVVGGGGVWL